MAHNTPEDAILQQAVTAAINTAFHGHKVSVHVSGQTVYFKGSVDSLAELSRAAKAAAAVEGVRNVDFSLLAITGEQPAINRDKIILEEAEQVLKRHPLLQDKPITVTVSQGQATATGAVEGLNGKLEAHRILSEINGVVSILNLIETTAGAEGSGPSRESAD